MKMRRVYDGALWCVKCEECPVVDYHEDRDEVVLHDPHKPQNGSFKMTAAEYNALIKNARPVA